MDHNNNKTVRVWDPGLRLFHWLLWGLAGPRHARFASFLYQPGTMLGNLGELRRGTAPRHLGHNPAGGVMILVMLGCLLVISVSGIALDAGENGADRSD